MKYLDIIFKLKFLELNKSMQKKIINVINKIKENIGLTYMIAAYTNERKIKL